MATPSLEDVWQQAVLQYQKNSKVNLVLPDKWKSVRSTHDAVKLLEEKQTGFKDYQYKGARLRTFLEPLLAFGIQFSDIVGRGVGITFPPASVIFAGIKHLLESAKGVNDNYETIAETFEFASGFIARAKVLTPHDIPTDLREILVKTLVNILDLFWLTEKQIRQGGLRAFMTKVQGGKDMITSLSDKFKRLFEEEERLVISLTYNEVYRKIREDELDKIDDFLKYPHPKHFHEQARSDHAPGTGQWILQGRPYKVWVKQPGKAMWICGRPGTGKTILFSGVVANLRAQCNISDDCMNYGNHGVGHFYCTVKDQSTLEPCNILGSLLMQLAWQCPYLPTPVMDLYRRRRTGLPTLSELVSALKDMLLLFSDTYLLIDALDECPAETWNSIRGHLVAILNDSQKNLHLLLVSRPSFDVSRTSSDVQTGFHEDTLICLDLSLVQSSVSKDIAVYIASYLATLDEGHILFSVDSNYRDMVQNTLKSRADGMFLLVHCHLNTVESCLNEEAIEESLKTLPADLFDIYHRILSSIPIRDNHRRDIKLVLQWLAFAQRPLTMHELCEVLTIDISSVSIIPKRRPPNPDVLLRHCSNLVTLSDGSVSLSHASVKDYLLSQELSAKQDICFFSLLLEDHQLLASRCLVYLLNSTSDMALWKYAKSYWRAHVNTATVDATEGLNSCLRELLGQFFLSKRAGEAEADLHHAVQHNDYNLAKLILKYPVDIEHRGPTGQTPLQLASEMGRLEMLELLLQHGADLRVSDHPHLHYAGNGIPTQSYIFCGVSYELSFPAHPHNAEVYEGTLLQLAAANRHLHVVDALLSHCTDFHAREGTLLHYIDWIGYNGLIQALPAPEASTGLHYTIKAGYLNIFWALLSYDELDITASDGNGWTPLHFAASKDFQSAVDALLLLGADLHAQDNNGDTPLYAALKACHDSIAYALLLLGADIHTRGFLEGTLLLDLAVSKGSQSLDNMLSSHITIVHTRDIWRDTLVYTAIESGHDLILYALLLYGINIDTRDEYGRTPLHFAVSKGSRSVVEILLSRGADIYTRDYSQRTPLHCAAKSGLDSMASVLLSHGAEVDPCDKWDQTPLHCAAKSGLDNMASVLLMHGAIVDARDYSRQTPLHCAAKSGLDSMASVLLSHGADVDTRDKWGQTPLHCLDSMASVLLSHGADVGARDNSGQTPLHCAAKAGNEIIANDLIMFGAKMDARATNGFTALGIAIRERSDGVVNALLSSGADINNRGEDGLTPLEWATSQQLDDVAGMLRREIEKRARAAAETQNVGGE